LSEVKRYLKCVHVYEYVDDNVQNEKMEVKEMPEDYSLFREHSDVLNRLSVDLFEYRVNSEHLILVISRDPTDFYVTSTMEIYLRVNVVYLLNYRKESVAVVVVAVVVDDENDC